MIIAQFYRHIFLRRISCGDERSRKKGKRRKYCIEIFYLLPRVFPGTCLEAEAQPQTNGPAIIDALVLIALVELSEKRVGIDLRNRQELPGNRVNI